jgi:hypothetical protein
LGEPTSKTSAMRIHILVVLLVLVGLRLTAQQDSTRRDGRWDLGLFPKKEAGNSFVQISGDYRFFGTYTRHFDPYLLNPIIQDSVLPRNIFIGDDSQLPSLTLRVAGRPNPRSSWGFDLYVFQFLTGAINTSYGTQVADSLRPSIQYPLQGPRLGSSLGMLLGMNLYGSFQTKRGTLQASVGGIQWVTLSDLTMASFRGYNRFILFERNPWDPTGVGLSSRYKQYFDQGSIDQDMRWGNRAFVGAVLQGTDMPGRTSFTAMVGKTELNGGFSQVPSFSYGGKFKKDWGAGNFVALNTINSLTYTDSLARETFGFHVITGEWNWIKNGFVVNGEAGMGQYFSPTNKEGWAELAQLKVRTPRRGRIPSVEVHAFRISPDVVNNNALYWNTATPEYRVNDIPAGQVGSTVLLQPFGSSMVRLGQITNNRQGVNINIETGGKALKFSGGMGFSSELRAAAELITFGNPVNQFTRSRLWRWVFPANVGPYNRYSDIFRDVYQTANLLDDSSGVVVNKKHFAVAEAQIKYYTKFLGRDLFVFSLFQMGSAQRDFSPIMVTTEKAYIRQYSSEAELYYAITGGFLLNLYYGYERTLGNYLTDIDEETLRPRNQYGEGIGVGCDVDMGKNTRLYLRHRWFSFRDESFGLDRFRGRELTVEIKAFF